MKKEFYGYLDLMMVLSDSFGGEVLLTDLKGNLIKGRSEERQEITDIPQELKSIIDISMEDDRFVEKERKDGSFAWCIPLKIGFLCFTGERKCDLEERMKQMFSEALPYIAKVCGGEAVLFDQVGTRLLSVASDGEESTDFVGKVSLDARETMRLQKADFGESNYINGAKAVRIPIGKHFGIGINNEDNVKKNLRLIDEMQKKNNTRYRFSDIVGESTAIIQAKNMARLAAQSNSNVLIYGNTGTGKEVFAQSIHNESPRFNKPFVAINCSAIPENLLESTFFGYDAGAFTGAKRGGAPGVLEQADGGTLFLDEVSEMQMDLQSKILRVIQEREVMRIGGEKPIQLDIRIIAATNKGLENLIKEGKFRHDLYYRLNVLDILLPSLKDILNDIPLLVEHGIARMNKVFGKNIKGISESALWDLMAYDWPGNVRELMNCIEKAFNLIGEDTLIMQEHLPLYLRRNDNPHGNLVVAKSLEEQLFAHEQIIIKKCLENNEGNRWKTAQDLNVSTTTLWRKMQKLDLL